MTKEELIKKIKELKYHNASKKSWIDREIALDLIKQLDEPQKAKVPQFVADWIERSKQEKRNLRNALNNGGEKMRLWFLDLENYDTFARAWLDGYEVEEKRYLVKLKGEVSESFFIYGLVSQKFFFSSDSRKSKCRRLTHTRKELEEAGFGEVFNSSLFEVDEVD